MKRLVAFGTVLGLLAFCGCASAPMKAPKTQLETREFQTKEYATLDTKMVMKAVLNVLQDDGYIVKNAVSDLGLISATKEIDVEKKGQAFWASFFGGTAATWSKNSVIEATVNVTEHGEFVRVRASFQAKTLDNKGGVRQIQQIEDENHYREFFAKVDKGVFLEKEKL